MRFTPTALLLALLVSATPNAALAQDTDVAVAVEILRDARVYIADGAESVDTQAMQRAVEQAAEYDLDLRVAVLAGSGDAESAAVAIRDGLGQVTVVVYTATAYGAASDEVSSERLEDALEAARDSLGGDTIENGVASFVSALEPADPFPWGLVLALVVLGVLVLAVGGRFWDSKARAERLARRIARRKEALQDRVSGISDEVLDLADRVELADSEGLSTRYRDAAADVRTLESEVEGAATMHDVDDIESKITTMESRFAALRTEADAASRS